MENVEEKVEDKNNSEADDSTNELKPNLTEESNDGKNIMENVEETSIDKEKE